MATILQSYLFSWKEVDELGDLERLKLVLENLPDESLMAKLGKKVQRKRRHDVRAMWNSLMALIVFQHDGIEALRRELKRNAQLRELCGFNPLLGVGAVPSAACYSRFLGDLQSLLGEVREMNVLLVEALQTLLPDFGKEQAVDSKAMPSHGKPSKKKSRMDDEIRTQTGEQNPA